MTDCGLEQHLKLGYILDMRGAQCNDGKQQRLQYRRFSTSRCSGFHRLVASFCTEVDVASRYRSNCGSCAHACPESTRVLDAAPARSLSYGISTRCASQGEGGRHGEIVNYVQRRSHSIGKGLRFRMMEQLHHPPLWQLRPLIAHRTCRLLQGFKKEATPRRPESPVHILRVGCGGASTLMPTILTTPAPVPPVAA